MARYIALLRGINVGGNKKVPMAQLRELLQGLAFTEVATLLQSGNAVFSAPKQPPERIGSKLEAAIARRFGFSVDVVVRGRDELARAIEANPLQGAEESPSQFLLTFLSEELPAKQRALLDPKAFAPDELAIVGRHIYARFPNGIRDSKLATLLTGPRLGVTATARNWNTVRKLLELA